MSVAKRLIASGLVHNGRCNLYAITINKDDAGDSIYMLKDGLDATGAILWECWATVAGCFIKNFIPQLLFETGLYLDITGKAYSVILEVV